MVEVLDQRRAVVLLDQVDDRLGQMVLPAEVDSVLDVPDDDERAHRRRQLGVAIGRPDLVFHEVVRLEHLADVVEIGPDPHQQTVGADSFGSRFGDRPDRDRMVVRARCPADELLKQRMGVVTELEQADAGDDSQRVLDEWQASAEQEARHQAPAGARGCRRGPGRAAGPATVRSPR